MIYLLLLFSDVDSGPVVISGGASVGDAVLTIDMDLGDNPGGVSYQLFGVQSPSTGKDLFVFNGKLSTIIIFIQNSRKLTKVNNIL